MEGRAATLDLAGGVCLEATLSFGAMGLAEGIVATDADPTVTRPSAAPFKAAFRRENRAVVVAPRDDVVMT